MAAHREADTAPLSARRRRSISPRRASTCRKNKAVKHRFLAVVLNRPEAAREMADEVRDPHLPAGDKRRLHRGETDGDKPPVMISIQPAIPINERIGAAAPFIPPNSPKTFCRPWQKNNSSTTMRIAAYPCAEYPASNFSTSAKGSVGRRLKKLTDPPARDRIRGRVRVRKNDHDHASRPRLSHANWFPSHRLKPCTTPPNSTP